MIDRLEAARDSFVAGEWSDACHHFEVADGTQPLGWDDLQRFAAAQYLIGREQDSVDTWTRAFHRARERDEAARAARSGFWIGFVLLNRGDLPGGSGWVARAQRALEDTGGAVVEDGYVRYLDALRAIFDGDVDGAYEGFREAAEIGIRFRDRDLETLARLGEGRALIRRGRHEDGVACLDEAIVAVHSGEVSPVVVGDSYCTAIEGCQELFDVDRTSRWTEDLSRWCEDHPGLVAFRGQCQLHRAEVLALRGSWPDALAEVDRALGRHARPAGQLAVGAAYYQRGELHRLRGEFAPSEAAYEEARRRGRQPQPGLALLRLAEGRTDDAEAGIHRALAESDDPTGRSRILPAAIEVLLAAADLERARALCDELEQTAASFRSRMLDAAAAQSRGRVRLFEAEHGEALSSLRRALELWHTLEVPYQAARAHVLMGQASRALGDEAGARAEWDAARAMLVDLGARPDLERLDEIAAVDDPDDRDTHGLSERQLEVLQHVAAGRSNQEIADALVISHRTVERHVSDIFTKLDVSSRAAATAYAYEHGLV
ncbi:MAG: LuxR C-terminal-related transcriptional regulator [Nitriliruptorales bacterium]|nr:LuxR C-terminal-related transcriptional regulator [Nitriliruptorales bacterium]